MVSKIAQMTVTEGILLDNNFTEAIVTILKAHLPGFFRMVLVVETAFFDAVLAFAVAC